MYSAWLPPLSDLAGFYLPPVSERLRRVRGQRQTKHRTGTHSIHACVDARLTAPGYPGTCSPRGSLLAGDRPWYDHLVCLGHPRLSTNDRSTSFLKHHGRSGGQGGDVRHLIRWFGDLTFSDLSRSREDEDEESARPTGEEPPASPGKNRRKRYVSSQCHRPPPPTRVGILGPENVGIQVIRTPPSRVLEQSKVYMLPNARPSNVQQ